jgi:SAM-dependent methyltransferase
MRDPSGHDYVQRWHDRWPGATSAVMHRPLDGDGRTSYELLAAAVPDTDRPVVDLACGDGYLAETIRRSRPARRIVGVDLNRAELKAAHARLGPAAALVRADSTALPFADASIGAVTTHFALMLLRPVEMVLAEVRRVLVHGGALVSVVPASGPPDEGDGWAALRGAFRATMAEHPVDVPDMEDHRVMEAGPLTDLLASSGFTVSTTPAVLSQRCDPATAHDHLMSTYGPDLFPPEIRTLLSARVRENLVERIGADGLVPMAHPILVVGATAR